MGIGAGLGADDVETHGPGPGIRAGPGPAFGCVGWDDHQLLACRKGLVEEEMTYVSRIQGILSVMFQYYRRCRADAALLRCLAAPPSFARHTEREGLLLCAKIQKEKKKTWPFEY